MELAEISRTAEAMGLTRFAQHVLFLHCLHPKLLSLSVSVVRCCLQCVLCRTLFDDASLYLQVGSVFVHDATDLDSFLVVSKKMKSWEIECE